MCSRAIFLKMDTNSFFNPLVYTPKILLSDAANELHNNHVCCLTITSISSLNLTWNFPHKKSKCISILGPIFPDFCWTVTHERMSIGWEYFSCIYTRKCKEYFQSIFKKIAYEHIADIWLLVGNKQVIWKCWYFAYTRIVTKYAYYILRFFTIFILLAENHPPKIRVSAFYTLKNLSLLNYQISVTDNVLLVL